MINTTPRHTNRLLILMALVCICFLEKNLTIIVMAAAIDEESASTQGFTLWNDHEPQTVRELQLTNNNPNNGKCWSTRDDRNPNRYCLFDDTPRSGAFLSLSCPTSKDNDLQKCECTIGIGDSKDAPNTDTCWKCGFCRDGSLAYDCRNVAEGTCIGRNCLDDCLSSYKDPEDLLLGSNANRAGLQLLMIPSMVITAAGVFL